MDLVHKTNGTVSELNRSEQRKQSSEPFLRHAWPFDRVHGFLERGHRFVFRLATSRCDRRVFEQTLADTLVWIWRGYHAD